ncbi:nuclease A inhibitor family protein [uncultured Deinococcus sp.]|uniref:nuclease A inhibitor family protein n=1 Tax=uncultured Deinococcus sp. TaxID=158789 RepID=UPI0025DC5BDA|nr:nuclease A inhibitor family protein [uncultured Deinococcus sp.]
MNRLLPLLLCTALMGCRPPSEPATPLAVQSLAHCPAAGIVHALAAATSGLVLLSETDAPWSWVWYPAQPLPTAAQMADLAGIPESAAEVEQPDFSTFFAGLGTAADPTDPASVDRARRYRHLRAVLEHRYTALRVYRVRDAVATPAVWTVFVLGQDACGTSGLESWAVET